MNVGTLQEFVADRLENFPSLVGATVLRHDGSDSFLENSKDRAQALASSGLCVTVFQPDGIGVSGDDEFAASITVGIAVLVEENAVIARHGGLGTTAAQAVDIVMGCICVTEAASRQTLILAETPFQNLGNIAGVQAFVVLFIANLVVTSTTV